MAKDIVEHEVNQLVEKELARRLLDSEIDEINIPKNNAQKLAQ